MKRSSREALSEHRFGNSLLGEQVYRDDMAEVIVTKIARARIGRAGRRP